MLRLKPRTRKVKTVKKSPVVDVKKQKKSETKKKGKSQKTAKVSPLVESKKVPTFDPEIQELENKFRTDARTVKKAVQGIITLTTENPKLKSKLFNEQFPLFLQINSIKVPNIHSRIVRIPLKHSVLPPDSEVCLIVPDVKGIPNKNHEEHLEHYEKLLGQKDVTNIKKIMTFHEFRTEYETFELKRRLVELYDIFLVDGRISGKTVKKCGKIFYNKRKVPTAVKLQATKLKEHIDQTLKKTPLYLHGKGDSFIVQIGHSKMKKKHVVENIFHVFKGIEKEFPGGFSNIRSLNLFTFRGLTIPIYVTLKNKSQIDTPQATRKQILNETVKGEITTRLNSGVIVKPTGEVTVYELEKHGKKRPGENKEDNNRTGNDHKTKAKKRKTEKKLVK